MSVRSGRALGAGAAKIPYGPASGSLMVCKRGGPIWRYGLRSQEQALWGLAGAVRPRGRIRTDKGSHARGASGEAHSRKTFNLKSLNPSPG